jgi:TetR/AcrR family transcriptional regulator, mexCD-oprJ operon repressor
MSHAQELPTETPDSLPEGLPSPEPIGDLGVRRASQRQLLQDRVTAAIVAAAAELLATRGSTSMADVAAAAGMARATVYRYFPTREALLERVADVAVTDAGARLAEARLGSVPPEEGLVRAIRAFFDVGDHFIVLARERVHVDEDRRKQIVDDPLRKLFARGQRSGVFRNDVPPEWLARALVGIVEAVASTSPGVIGRDDTVARVSSVFLEGIRRAPPSV